MSRMTRSAYGLDTPRGTHWAERSACRIEEGVDPELWWPEDRSRATLAGVALARHTCLVHCPVLDQCRRYAKNNPPKYPCVLGGEQYVSVTEYRAKLCTDGPTPSAALCERCPIDADEPTSGSGLALVA